jgi:hypothetical protein
MTTGGHSGADPRGLATALIDDGRPLLTFTGLMLVLSGLFALFLSVSGNFLPHDVAYLQMTSGELCSINECRIVHFMFHDRVSFGGSLIAIGTLYLWIVEFPLRQRQPWAWWLLVLSGLLGFGSFLAYLGYGYLDTWHGAATLALLPCFLIGLKKTCRRLDRPARVSSLLHSADTITWATPSGIGRLLLLITAGSLAVGGLIIMTVGMTCVFVPQDLQFMGLTTERLQALNPRLIPLIAHDRAGFGGGVFTCGVTMFFCIWCGEPSRSLWQALLITGIAGFGTAIAVHPAIGYTDLFHLGPALLGAAMFVLGIALTSQQYNRRAPSSVG